MHASEIEHSTPSFCAKLKIEYSIFCARSIHGMANFPSRKFVVYPNIVRADLLSAGDADM